MFRGAERELDSVAFSPDGKFLAAGELGGVIRIWQIESRELFARLKLDSNSVNQLAFSADGTRLIARDSDDRAWEFEITASVPSRSLPGLFDLSAWAAGEAILGFHEKLESTFQDAASGHAAGWYPESLKGLARVHGANAWSGTSGGRVHLVKLETEGEMAAMTAAADVREIEEPDTGSSGGWWNNLKRRLFRS
ncbi:MAG: hypothetical protein U0872_00455 [Planctomycetaceae bacterium]